MLSMFHIHLFCILLSHRPVLLLLPHTLHIPIFPCPHIPMSSYIHIVHLMFTSHSVAGTCPVLCSSNGEYEEGACRCYPGWKGAECSIRHNECEVSLRILIVDMLWDHGHLMGTPRHQIFYFYGWKNLLIIEYNIITATITFTEHWTKTLSLFTGAQLQQPLSLSFMNKNSFTLLFVQVPDCNNHFHFNFWIKTLLLSCLCRCLTATITFIFE